MTRINGLAFGDERVRLGTFNAGPGLLERALNVSPGYPLGLQTYDVAIGDTTLWDDLDTTDVVETRDTIIASAFYATYTALTSRFGSDAASWTWGRLHTVTLTPVIPATTSDAQLIPSPSDPLYANGFPRHGDYGAVDVGDYGLWSGTTNPSGAESNAVRTTIGDDDFKLIYGATQRLVVEMLPEGPRAYNVIAGGQSMDPDSPHFADEAGRWWKNEALPINFEPDDVAADAELKLELTPAGS